MGSKGILELFPLSEIPSVIGYHAEDKLKVTRRVYYSPSFFLPLCVVLGKQYESGLSELCPQTIPPSPQGTQVPKASNDCVPERSVV